MRTIRPQDLESQNPRESYGFPSQMLQSLAGWWFQPTPLKNHGQTVSWDH